MQHSPQESGSLEPRSSGPRVLGSLGPRSSGPRSSGPRSSGPRSSGPRSSGPGSSVYSIPSLSSLNISANGLFIHLSPVQFSQCGLKFPQSHKIHHCGDHRHRSRSSFGWTGCSALCERLLQPDHFKNPSCTPIGD